MKSGVQKNIGGYVNNIIEQMQRMRNDFVNETGKDAVGWILNSDHYEQLTSELCAIKGSGYIGPIEEFMGLPLRLKMRGDLELEVSNECIINHIVKKHREKPNAITRP